MWLNYQKILDESNHAIICNDSDELHQYDSVQWAAQTFYSMHINELFLADKIMLWKTHAHHGTCGIRWSSCILRAKELRFPNASRSDIVNRAVQKSEAYHTFYHLKWAWNLFCSGTWMNRLCLRTRFHSRVFLMHTDRILRKSEQRCWVFDNRH